MISIIIFILVLGAIVLVHEWGHFIAAKKSGMIVEEFGFGFPPKIFSIKKGGTVYSLNLLPLGGFVKILGEDGGQNENADSFSSKSVWARSLVTVSGVFMNFMLAIFLLIIGFNIGLPQIIDKDNELAAKNIEIQIIAVSNGSPAENAGIKMGDAVKYLKIDGKNTVIGEISTLQNIIESNRGKELTINLKRGSETLEVSAIPRINPPEGDGPLGIALAKTGIISYPWYESIWLGIKSAFSITWEIMKGFGNLFKNLLFQGRIPQELSGPVGIAVLTTQAANLGFIYLLQLVAIVSLNLTILNLLPFPALDGGRLLFLAIEKIKGSKVNPKVENAFHSIGLVLILVLFVLLTYRDILRLN
ncbi:MAG: RIP metalloprotease RseP [Candidatus Azambacteria bacterium]|nr:RIP metalloprotease RseP [Candidatus Azambacteria bacterium]